MPTTSTFTSLWRTSLLVSLATLAAGNVHGRDASDSQGGALVVALASGRSFVGEVDSETDMSTLWLRQSLPGGHVLRPINWSRVVQVELDGEIYSGEQFHESVRVVRETSVSGLGEAAESSIGGDQSAIILGPSQTPPHAPPPWIGAADVRSIAIDAYLANWDADVEPDGIVLELLPLDRGGLPVAVHGTVEANLFAERVGVVKRPESFERIGRWTRRVAPADFGVYGACYLLAFQGVHPDFDLRWATHGALNVRLSVPGGGVFEQTASTLRIRPYSSVRDHLEQASGHRYFYLERTGRGDR